MPELPEVEVVRAGLAPAITGARVSGVEVFDARSLRRYHGDFEAELVGARVDRAVRRGKFLWFPLDETRALTTHLGMSGQMLLREPGTEDRLTRIRLTIEHPEHGELWINFVDQRIFGGMSIDPLVPTRDGGPGGFVGDGGTDAALIPAATAHIGRDPLDPAFDAEAVIAAMRKRSSGIKRLLLDQDLLSGIGNIYADEALWLARLHFDRPGTGLPKTRGRELIAAVQGVLRKALAEGGTSFDAQYVNVNGNSGYFAHSLNAYGQQGKPCPRCGTEIRRVEFMNRGSHYCPRCQRRR